MPVEPRCGPGDVEQLESPAPGAASDDGPRLVSEEEPPFGGVGVVETPESVPFVGPASTLGAVPPAQTGSG